MKQSKISFKTRTVLDDQLLKEWHKNDPEHQSSDADFFIDPAPGRQHLTVNHCDEPVLFLTVENVARVHIQFNPNGGKLKTCKTLIMGLTWLIKTLKERGYHELIFDSKFPSLIKFCQSALGFFKLNQDYSTRL